MDQLIKGAILSKDKQYRYQLWRIWDNTKPFCMFIMLNPSTADADKDDATIRRCTGFAKSWGFGGFYVGNLFAFRSTDPKSLLFHSEIGTDIIGSENIFHIKEMAENVKQHCAHGETRIL